MSHIIGILRWKHDYRQNLNCPVHELIFRGGCVPVYVAFFGDK